MTLIKLFVISCYALFLTLTSPSHANNARVSTPSSISINSDTEISYSVFPAESKHLLLWFYSEAGPQPSDKKLAQQLSSLGTEVWVVDLFESYFLPTALSSMDKIPEKDLNQFMRYAHKLTGKSIIAISTGRSAIPLLRAARQHQLETPLSKILTGLILVSPKFYVETPNPGQDGTLMPIVSNSNLLLFLIQPHNSPWFWKLDKTIPALEKSGSDVFLQVMGNVRDRFYFRPDANNYEQQITKTFANNIAQAISAIDNYPPQLRSASKKKSINPEKSKNRNDRSLKPHQGKGRTPHLKLTTAKDNQLDLNELSNKVVLVNFWATWCPPCVHEMPSMQRLQDKFNTNDFTILGVNMAEDKKTITHFLKTRVSVNFPILMDTDGAALKRWQVFAFPTSYLIDKKGRIRYSLFGSIEWDSEENVSIIKNLINE